MLLFLGKRKFLCDVVDVSLRTGTETAFWRRVRKSSSCWEWIGKRGKGYGILRINGYYACAHRVSWILNRGRIPEGILICHSCDNPSCVNPDHLFLGTYQDNSDDAKSKGRVVNGNIKLTQEKAEEIRGLYKPWPRSIKGNPMSLKKLGAMYGVSDNCIMKVVSGKTWLKP